MAIRPYRPANTTTCGTPASAARGGELAPNDATLCSDGVTDLTAREERIKKSYSTRFGGADSLLRLCWR